MPPGYSILPSMMAFGFKQYIIAGNTTITPMRHPIIVTEMSSPK